MESSVSPIPRGRPKDTRKRQDILQAAKELFTESGFFGTSMDALAKAANVSKATLYSHFDDKDALYRALIRDKMADYQVDDFSDMLNWDVARDLQVIATHMLDLIFDPEALDMLRMVIAEGRAGSNVPALFQEVGPKRLLGQIADYLARQKARGTSYIEDIEADTGLFASLVVDHRTMMFALMGVGDGMPETDRERHARQAVARFIKLKRLETAAH
ncbi:MAG: TetR/AcrR family transcriptional regulator [Parvibaculales bacterium]